MSDPLFFRSPVTLSLAEIAVLTGAQCRGDATFRIHALAPLETAGRDDLTFLDLQGPVDAGLDAALKTELVSDLKEMLATTRARACLVTSCEAHSLPPAVIPLITSTPRTAASQVLAALFPPSWKMESSCEASGISPGAHVHPEARLETGVTVDPAAVIGPRAEIGTGTLVGAGSVIGPDVRIGRHCAIGPGASLSHALIGNQVVLAPGVRLGQASFLVDWSAAPGRVIVQDKVAIGPGSTIDRGILRDTIIGEGTIVGALAVIGADVSLGRFCRVAARVGLDTLTVFADGAEIR
ncbi:LpxD N-terminal domain-containing protein [Beijerinckia mobilis]|uniref:LpxD N-terminal domain-containing protein n=1 Tax=Beijerinckia mobilis TaxID=231434 RepID=UPI00068E507E|nr:LpxD N-terminal domain-containing protein [Beijerinckia mobilis]